MDRDEIRNEYGNRLPRVFPGPEKSMSVAEIFSKYTNGQLYFDDVDLVLGDETIIEDFYSKKNTVADIAKAINLKL
jgi:hypothetical protein